MTGTILLILRIILLASLYGFLAWAFYLLWRDLRRQSETVAFVQTPPITLLTPDGTPLCHFSKPEFAIGRDQACDCSLEDKTVSTQHARLSFHHTQWWLEDLGSTNGTFLNEERVHTPVVVTTGDELRCGQVCLKISIGEPVEAALVHGG